MYTFPDKVEINDVCSRDGLQNEKEFFSTDKKIELVNRLSRIGLKKIEVTSFVSPKAVPQMKDAFEVMSGIQRNQDVTYVALVPNEKGADRAIAAGADEINVFVSASEAHNKANVGMSINRSLENIKIVIGMAKDARTPVNVTLATSFGCPFTGDVDVQQVIKIIDQVIRFGCDSITFGDTTGMASPVKVYKLIEAVNKQYGENRLKLTLHFHDTRGMAMANVLAGLHCGIYKFEGSLAGLGGCPFAPGATGNIPTEDMVHMMIEMGIDTGIDLFGLIDAAKRLEKDIGRVLPGQVMKSGPASVLKPLPE